MHQVTKMSTLRSMTAGTLGAILLASLAIANLVITPALADPDDSPVTGPWAEDGSTFDDWVRLSADDPSADPDDWYRVNLSAGATELDLLTVRANLTRDGGDEFLVWAAIHDPDGALLTEVRATSYAVRSASTLCHRTGVYLVHVYTYSKYECHYRIRFEISKAANVTDGDDTLDAATWLDPPTEVTGHLHGIFDPFDHYAVNLTRDALFFEVVEARLDLTGTQVGRTDLDLFLIVRDARGVPREVASSTSNSSLELALFAATEENTTVFIRCHAYGGDTDYVLNVTKRRVSDDGNNRIDRAEALSPGAVRNDSLNESDVWDFFRVNLTGGDIVWVNLTTHDYNATLRKPNLNLYLYSPDERIVNWSHSYDPLERVTYQVPLADPPVDHYILVTYFDRTPRDGVPAFGNYTLTVEVDHAPRLMADLPLVVEEDGELRLPLEALVRDPEDRLASVELDDSEGLTVGLEAGDVVLVPDSNLSGPASFSLLARDDHRTVTLTVPVNVTPVPDAPAAVSPFPTLELDEDTEASWNLTELVVDGDGDPLTFELITTLGMPLWASHLSGSLLTVVPEADFFGKSSLSVVAEDPSGLRSTIDLVFHVVPVEDPPRLLMADPNVTTIEDQRGLEVDLGEVIADPDGEELTYSVETVPHATFILLGHLLVIDPEADFSGELLLKVTARDGEGAEVTADIRLDIVPVNDPPRVTSKTPVEDVKLSEGEAMTFVVTATDPEGSPLVYAWFLDGETVLGEELPRYQLVTNFSSKRIYLVSVRVSDGELVTWSNWTAQVVNVNRPPTIVLQRPKQGATYTEGKNVVFEALVDDPDGEALSVQWILGGKVVGTGPVFTTSSLKTGKHHLTARVTDPHGSAAEAEVTFNVEEASGAPGPGALMALAALSASGLVILATDTLSRRRS